MGRRPRRHGDEGERMAAAGNYDLIILDMRLPGKVGIAGAA